MAHIVHAGLVMIGARRSASSNRALTSFLRFIYLPVMSLEVRLAVPKRSERLFRMRDETQQRGE